MSAVRRRGEQTCINCGAKFTPWMVPGVGLYHGYYCEDCHNERRN